ncbi:hypothetical protein GA0074695_4083 [Micromonospora viridifaciens]|uniref:Uncharacterized protein n=1 Tax=Micromonospora viridifaciens TaxID=1881 RepID=A0A1C4YBZ8_MICVI|nr:hypothetical protein [Micromonospora viridifaciens]SCF18200.1 hypothetical protein GA0074695_4083 [Micromonospora viridifaciens]
MTTPLSSGARLLAERLGTLLGPPAATPGPQAGRRTFAANATTTADSTATATAAPTLPAYVEHLLARWSLLHDLPFRYLVPDARLLPAASIRFFRLDTGWLAQLRAGALAVGGDGSRERAATRTLLPQVTAAVTEQLPLVREVQRTRMSIPVAADLLTEARLAGELSATDAAVPVTGFLLRSALVSGWPGMEVRAWASDSPADVPPGVDPDVLARNRPDLVVELLRLERLSPSVLIALFRGAPRLVWLEEPPQSVQFGLEAAGSGWQVPIRDGSGRDVGMVPVPMRPASPVPGVVDVERLARALDQARPLPRPRGGAAVALSLLQAPSRQRFGASTPPS